MDKDGSLLTNPVHYRDARNAVGQKEAFDTMSAKEIYERTGIQILDFNTLYQLVYAKKITKITYLKNAKKPFLFMPDLFELFSHRCCKKTNIPSRPPHRCLNRIRKSGILTF
ncbi:MAG: hypothetical protein L6V93_09780 [Clostridiales bacterium]|nr:MAG: hypothetical protein L6V93_09780 [Clostridiales bacterium]